MEKIFNVNADCHPDLHYMVDLRDRLGKIKKMVDAGQYFTINRARQYGKTTTLLALSEYLKDDYIVINLDFQLFSAVPSKQKTPFHWLLLKPLLPHGTKIKCPLLMRYAGSLIY